MGRPSPIRPLLLLAVLGALARLWRADAGTVRTELVAPDFEASYLLFIDTLGVFLRSSSGAFEAAVHSPAGQQDRYYLAVLHAPSGTCVWAANRAAPITNRAAPFRLSSAGVSAEDANGTVVWSTPPFASPVAALRLADSGNLALLDGRNGTLWQSFDRPTDSLVSSQRLPVGGFLSSAVSASDLAEGDYRLNVTAADAVLAWMGSLYWRLSGEAIAVKDRDGTVAYMAVNGTGIYLLAADDTVVVQAAMPPAGLRIVQLGVDGKLQISSFASANSSSSPMDGGIVAPSRGCALPLSCGALGLCTPNGNGSTCTCPPPFPTAHDNGCAPSVGSTLLPEGGYCGGGAGGGSMISYLSLGSGIAYYANKFSPPATAGSNASSCQALCTSNCSCLGYFYDSSSLSCYLAQNQLASFINTNSSNGAGMSGYIKVQSSQRSSSDSSSSNKTLIAILLPTIIAFVLVVVVGAIVIASRRNKDEQRVGRRASRSRDVQLRRQRSPGSASAHLVRDLDNEDDGDDDIVIPGLPTRFTHDEIEDMTNSYRTKIGAGGFGAVYKGELPDGSLVAVKKIEGVGMQGKREFMTEIAVIGNIHHVNLVRLRGFCTEGHRRLLVYEYMNRGSLDRPLFRPAGPLLEWKERVDIAIGAARGLAYLHFGCNQRIIHCDVKPENILLADGGQVKIADFGLAKFLTPEQSGLFTTMRGTRGYLAPEWLTNTAITDRTDVYGFGKVLLELVHGRKNRSEHVSDGGGGGEDSNSSNGTAGSSSRSGRNDYFPLVALEGHEAGRYAELADPRLEGRVVGKEVERMVKVALCCLHEDPHTRPSMAVVAGMLEGTMELGEPRAQALGFLRLYGRGFAGPSDGNVMKQVMVGDRARSETTMSGWPSYMSSSQLSGAR
ncbi:hypothetical protein ZWY2020_022811 [Hordeum vulgare]|nr:hypothetical protein ZWY2020_022811 [Hordeum vulgare]